MCYILFFFFFFFFPDIFLFQKEKNLFQDLG